MKQLLVAIVLALTVVGCASDDAGPDDASQGLDPVTPDAAPDANAACAACGSGTICVQLLNGTCGSHAVECKPIVTGCEQPVCSTACDNAYCDRQISTCSAAPCAEDIPGAFHCYGV